MMNSWGNLLVYDVPRSAFDLSEMMMQSMKTNKFTCAISKPAGSKIQLKHYCCVISDALSFVKPASLRPNYVHTLF